MNYKEISKASNQLHSCLKEKVLKKTSFIPYGVYTYIISHNILLYDPKLTQNSAGFWHILGETSAFSLHKEWNTRPDVTTTRPLSRESQRFCKHLDPIRRLWLASSADVCRHENIPWVAGICSRSAAAITPHW